MLSRLNRHRPARPSLRVETLETRETPAVLDIVGGVLTFTAEAGETNTTSAAVSAGYYKIRDAGATITLGAGALAAGWAGSGTSGVYGRDATVSSLAVNLGDGNDTFNLHSTNDPVTVSGDAGDDKINLSSNGAALIGHLRGINANVSVVAGEGVDLLALSDTGAISNNGNAVIGNSSITGMAGWRHDRVVGFSASGGGSFGLIHLMGSNRTMVQDTFTLNNPGAAVQLDANAGNDVINVRALSQPATVNAGAGNDAIAVSSSATAAAGNLDGINAALTINAGAGVNSLALNDFASAAANTDVQVAASTITGFAGAANDAVINYTATGGSFASFRLDGSDTAADQFSVGALAGLTSADVRGNGGDDLFVVTGAARAVLTGGTGADGFSLPADGTTLTGSIDGGAGSDTLTYAGRSAGTATALTQIVSGAGFDGTGTDLSGGFAGIDSVVGGGGTDTLTGLDAVSTWTLDTATTYASGGASLGFSGFDALGGGAAADTFHIAADQTLAINGNDGDDDFVFTADGATLTGNVEGGTGNNSLRHTGYAQAVAVVLTGSAATGFGGTATGLSGGFAGVSSVAGGGNAGDTLTGENADSTWTLGASQKYGDGTGELAFSGFENLQGGGLNDTFHVTADTAAGLNGGAGADRFLLGTDGVTLTGGIVGGTGHDTLSYQGRSTAGTVSLNALAAAGFGGSGSGLVVGFSGVDELVGGGADTLNGEDAARTWTLDAVSTYGDGTDSLTFAGYNVLRGGTAADTFDVRSMAAARTLVGGDGDDSFTLSSVAQNLDAITGALTVAGEGGTDTLTLNDQNNATAAAWGVSDLAVTRGTMLADHGSVETLNVNAGSGGNTFDVDGTPAGTTFNLNAGSGSNTITVGEFNNTWALGGLLALTGTGSNIFTVDTTADTGNVAWALSNTGISRNGSAAITFANAPTEALVFGGAGDDSFDVTPAAGTLFTVAGGVGGTQTNTLAVHTGGAAATDDGTKVSVTGLLDVFYFGLSGAPTTPA